MDFSLSFPQPIIYYLLGGAALTAFAVLALLPPRRVSREAASEATFLLSAWAALFACRWPIFLWPDPLNPDEGAFIACAMKAKFDWIPWRGFDAGSSGPLNCDILALPALFGAHLGFCSARVTGLCLIAGAICALYYTVKWIYGAGVARLSVVPPVLLFALTRTADFVPYSSEYLSIFLTTVALAAVAHLVRGAGSKSSRLIACAISGLCLGSTPFAKLQASPISLAVLVSLAVALFITSPRFSIGKRLEGLALVAALLAVPAAIVISLCVTGTLMDAVIPYYIMSLNYIGSRPPVGISYFFLSAEDYTVFLTCSLVVILAAGGLLYSRIHFDRVSVWASLSSILLSLASFFAIYQAHRAFPHYLLFSVVPVSFCVANVLGLVRFLDQPTGRAMLVRGLFVIFFLIPLGITTFESSNDFNPRAIVPRRAEVAAMSRYAKPGDRMVVWGWRPEYYVQTKTIMSTRDPSIERLLLQTPYREYFRERFISDLRAHPPLVFVDGVAPGAFVYNNRATCGIETFPALEAFVREHYTEREEVAGVRIFVAKDHLNR
ncbi:MAG: hypothetical protein QOC70_890 [Verrucomicrobiota bacterium]|jgi:hypothetical protein